MAEYIERGDVIKIINHEKIIPLIHREILQEKVKLQPTADVVEVVRCKDCQHYIDGKCYVSNRKPRFAYNVNIHSRKEDDYCSYGERKCDNG